MSTQPLDPKTLKAVRDLTTQPKSYSSSPFIKKVAKTGYDDRILIAQVYQLIN